MIISILAIAELGALTIWSVNLIPVLILFIYAFILGLVIIVLIRLMRYLGSAKKEQKLMRIELGKLAEEVHILRQELKGNNDE